MKMVRRAGCQVVKWLSRNSNGHVKGTVKAMLQEQYLMLTQNEVWGSQVDDLVWMACFADADIAELAKKAERVD